MVSCGSSCYDKKKGVSTAREPTSNRKKVLVDDGHSFFLFLSRFRTRRCGTREQRTHGGVSHDTTRTKKTQASSSTEVKLEFAIHDSNNSIHVHFLQDLYEYMCYLEDVSFPSPTIHGPHVCQEKIHTTCISHTPSHKSTPSYYLLCTFQSEACTTSIPPRISF